MKKLGILLIGFFVVSMSSFAQQSPRVTAESENISVSYGQPSKRGRDVFGGLVPYGQVWRTGANEATEITFKKDATFGGAKVKAGTYSLFTIPGEKEWTIILNSERKQWGAYNYDKIKDKDVATIKVKSQKQDALTEALTISTDDKNVTIAWDKTNVSIPVKF